jgi:hypothetical protein
VWVEVVLFNAERRRQLTSLVEVFHCEHHVLLASNAFDDITTWVDKVAFGIRESSLLVLVVTLFVLESDDISFLVPFPVTYDIKDVEVPLVSIWHCDYCLRSFTELLQGLLKDLNLCVAHVIL